MREVEIVGLGVEDESGSPLVVLRETEEPYRVLPIFVGGSEAAAIGLALAGDADVRPSAHEVMAALVESLDAHVDRVEVTELRDGTFVAELALTGPLGDRRLDARPSDAIALALRVDAPMFVSDDVLNEAGGVLADGSPDDGVPDDETIDAEVAAFAALLDDVDPGDFASPPDGSV